MSHDRLVPLIIAVALFMENMDSTIIATSLPAIAADIGANPLALKLAVTSYLLSLAVFIPASGWTADRFGARTVFRAAIAVFVLGSIGCAISTSLTGFVIARIVQGIGGAMMTPVGRLVLVRSIDRRALVGAMVWVTMPALIGPGAVASAAYVVHARRTPAPVLDLRLLGVPTFRAGVAGGFLFRLGAGAMPFLLPLMLQVGFKLTPFQSGLITFCSAIGAMT